MNPEYAEIFRQRGHPYHDAMTRFPLARAEEFSGLFTRLPLGNGERILDIPAGGGYLAKHLGDRALVTSLEITHGFSDEAVVVQLEDLARFSGFDRAVCLAALHHFDQPMTMLSHLAQTLRPGGSLHVADICAGSPLCEFLDGFVGRYNQTGHQGRYLRADAADYRDLGRVARCEEVGCAWSFDDETSLLAFCSRLFGLVECPPSALRTALHDLVGVRADSRGVVLEWRLLYIDIIVPTSAEGLGLPAS